MRPRSGSLSPYILIVTALVSAFAAALAMYLVMRPGNSDDAEPSHIPSPHAPTPSTSSVSSPTPDLTPTEAAKPTPPSTPTPTAQSAPPSPTVESPTQNPAWPVLDDGWTILDAVVHKPSDLDSLDEVPQGRRTRESSSAGIKTASGTGSGRSRKSLSMFGNSFPVRTFKPAPSTNEQPNMLNARPAPHPATTPELPRILTWDHHLRPRTTAQSDPPLATLMR